MLIVNEPINKVNWNNRTTVPIMRKQIVELGKLGMLWISCFKWWPTRTCRRGFLISPSHTISPFNSQKIPIDASLFLLPFFFPTFQPTYLYVPPCLQLPPSFPSQPFPRKSLAQWWSASHVAGLSKAVMDLQGLVGGHLISPRVTLPHTTSWKKLWLEN